MTELKLDERDSIELGGFCPVCNLQKNGRVHLCPGSPLPHRFDPYPVGAQFEDELTQAQVRQGRRRYGQRLADGFELLADSGWDN